MSDKEQIRLFASMFNTIQEMVWTLVDNWIVLDNQKLQSYLDSIDNKVKKEFDSENKKEYEKLTDHISDRIYFNC